MPPLFPLGSLVATQGIIAATETGQITPEQVAQAVRRHVTGDWANLDPEDQSANKQAVEQGMRVLSCYTLNKTRVYVITESDRSVTTVLLPEEY
jgi:predicted RNA-binding protein associated with RNAse of E/G family